METIMFVWNCLVCAVLGPSELDNFTDELRGVIPRSFEYLFFLINREVEKVSYVFHSVKVFQYQHPICIYLFPTDAILLFAVLPVEEFPLQMFIYWDI